MAEKSPKRLKTLWEKEKLLVTSNFSFSHSVFKRLKEFADYNFDFMKWRRVLRNCSLRAVSHFPTVFSEDLYWVHVKTRGLFWKWLSDKTGPSPRQLQLT